MVTRKSHVVISTHTHKYVKWFNQCFFFHKLCQKSGYFLQNSCELYINGEKHADVTASAHAAREEESFYDSHE